MRPALGVALVIVALAPAAHLAWTARDVPHLGYFHDDSIYWVCARSIAKGAGYRIASLPGQPYQTKYPPAYPLLLAGVWKLDSEFPANLRLALALNWLLLPAFVLLARWSFTDLGVRPAHAWMLSAALALNPYNALCGISLLSDLLFGCLLIAALALIERSRRPETRTWMAAAAGLAAAAAFLTRPVGVLLLAVGPALFLPRKQYQRAALFAGTMLPGVLAWAWWVHSHRAAGGDLALLYYTDYLGYLNSGPLADLPMVAWTNFDSLIRSLGGMLLFGLGDSFWAKSLARVVAVAAVAGVVRLARRNGPSAYHLFTAAYLPVLLACNFMPDQRFLVPVFPVLLAGAWAEMLALAQAVQACYGRAPAVSGRAPLEPRNGPGVVLWRARNPAILAILMLAALLVLAVARTGTALFSVLPRFVERHRADLAHGSRARQWIRDNVPGNARVLAYQDAVLYLYTGRRACRLVIPPGLLYRGDREAIRNLFTQVADFAHAHGLEYAIGTPSDWSAELGGEDLSEAQRLFRSNPRLRLLYSSGGVSVFKVD